MLIGCAYLERGVPVVVLVRWGYGGGPRNVLVRRADGSRVVRPFRGLRRAASPPKEVCGRVPGSGKVGSAGGALPTRDPR
jgi:acetyl esterase